MLEGIQAVIFDLDGTLVDSMWMWKNIDIEYILLETDSPYLTPVPFRGKENKPAYVKYVAQEIANIRNITYEEIVDITTRNAEDFFGI